MCLCIIWKLRLDLCWTAVYFSTRVNSNFHKKAVFICFTGGSIATLHHKEQFISIVIYLVSKCEQFIFYREGFLERWARRQINFDISPNQIQYELYSMGKQGTKQYKKKHKKTKYAWFVLLCTRSMIKRHSYSPSMCIGVCDRKAKTSTN